MLSNKISLSDFKKLSWLHAKPDTIKKIGIVAKLDDLYSLAYHSINYNGIETSELFEARVAEANEAYTHKDFDKLVNILNDNTKLYIDTFRVPGNPNLLFDASARLNDFIELFGIFGEDVEDNLYVIDYYPDNDTLILYFED